MRQAVVPLLLALLYSSSLLAESREPETPQLKKDDEAQWYQADIIIFRNETTKDATTEKWPEARFRPTPQNTLKLSSPDVVTVHSDQMPELHAVIGTQPNTIQAPDLKRDPFIELPDSEQLLNVQATTLRRSSNYTVLAQMAWRLPVHPDQKEKPVLIETPVSHDSAFMLSGSVVVSSSRFLHVDVDVWYNELRPEALSAMLMHKEERVPLNPLQMQDHTTPLRVAKSFHIRERRRIQRTSEVQYLDSPVIGILLKLTPYETPEPDLLINTPNST